MLAFLRERMEPRPRPASRAEQLILDPGPGLRQDASADDRPARGGRAAARARAPAADGDLAQGLHRRAHRRAAARAPARDARGARPRGRAGAHIFRVHDVAAAADFLRCARRCAASEAAGISRSPRNRYDRWPTEQPLEPLARRRARLRRTTGARRCPTRRDANRPSHTKEEHLMTVLERSELEASPLADLHAIADQLGLEGFSRLRKAELIDAILDEPGLGGSTRRGAAERARRAPARSAGGAARGAAPRSAAALARRRARARRRGAARRRGGAREEEPSRARRRARAARSRAARPREGARRAPGGAARARAARDSGRGARRSRAHRRGRRRGARQRLGVPARRTRPSPPTRTSTSPPRRCAAASSSPATA